MEDQSTRGKPGQGQGHENEPMPAYWDSVMMDKDQMKSLTQDDVVRCYDQWAKEGSYEKTVDEHGYGALDVLESTMNQLFPNKADVTVMDVGACTGFSGQRLHKMGFVKIDGLDPSSESLRVAEQKGVYRTLYNLPMTSDPLDIPAGTDVPGPVKWTPCASDTYVADVAMHLTGGYIVNLSRTEYLDHCPDYVSKWDPMIEGHVTAGEWKLVEKVRYDHHFHDRAGYKHVFQVC